MSISLLGKRPPEQLSNSRMLKKQKFTPPEKDLAHVNLGYSHLALGLHAKAEEHFMEATNKLKTKLGRAYFGLSEAYKEQGQFDFSVGYAIKAFQHNFHKSEDADLALENQNKIIENLNRSRDHYVDIQHRKNFLLCLKVKAYFCKIFGNEKEERCALGNILLNIPHDLQANQRANYLASSLRGIIPD